MTTTTTATPQALIAAARADGRTVLLEHEAYALVGAAGIATPAHFVVPVGSEPAAEQLATLAGDRVVLKIVSPHILHKTDVGGVKLGVAPADAAAAYEEIVANSRKAMPDARIDGVLVSPMAADGVDCILGSGHRDHVLLADHAAFGQAGRAGCVIDHPYIIRLYGRNHLIGQEPWHPGRPIHIIHGRLDPDVPFAHSERLVAMLRGSSVELTEVPDGEHRLSRLEDLERLYRVIEAATSMLR